MQFTEVPEDFVLLGAGVQLDPIDRRVSMIGFFPGVVEWCRVGKLIHSFFEALKSPRIGKRNKGHSCNPRCHWCKVIVNEGTQRIMRDVHEPKVLVRWSGEVVKWHDKVRSGQVPLMILNEIWRAIDVGRNVTDRGEC